jgi:hypothetical protein
MNPSENFSVARNADLFGHVAPAPEFVDIRNQRESVAEEKARLCMELNSLCKTPPRSLGAASIQVVRSWRAELKNAMKVLASKDSSRQQLTAAISTMRGFA